MGSNPQGEHGKVNFIDENGVVHHLSWKRVLDVPELATLSTFDAIARQAYSDFAALDAVHFTYPDIGHPGSMPARMSDFREILVHEYIATFVTRARQSLLRWGLDRSAE